MRLLLLVPLAMYGCQQTAPKTVTAVAAAQSPAEVIGAGATLVSPGNAKEQTTMTAQRRIGYQWPLPTTGLKDQPAPTVPPAWIDEKVTTVISPHQDAAAIIKVAETASAWSKTRWIGISLIVVALLFALYYRGTPDGYPLVYAKVVCIGTVIAIVDPSPYWLFVLIIPAVFYVGQKLKLFNLPGLL